MPLSEIELQQLETLYHKVNGNPKTRHEFQRIAKEADPNLRIPEYEARNEVETRLEKTREEIKSELEELRKQNLMRDYEETRKSAKQRLAGSPHFLSSEEFPKVEEIMREKGIGDYDVAATYFRAQVTPLKPSGFGAGRQRTQLSDWKKELKNPDSELWKDRNAWADKEAVKAWDELEDMSRGS
jgi:hypothetical protein